MRLREITESPRQIDEFLPAVAGVGIGALTWLIISKAIDAYFVYTAVDEIMGVVAKHGGNVTKITDDEWWDISITVIVAGLALTPLPGKAIKWTFDKVSKAIPAELKSKIINLVKSKFVKSVEIAPANKAASTSGGSASGSDIYKPQPRRNRVDSVPSTKSAEPAPATPKNPNWVDKPFQKEELMRLAGLAK